MYNLEGTPYLLDANATRQVEEKLRWLEDRVALLRGNGKLTAETLKHYYGEKRFEQVAESNALEGSTLSAGETELAVLKGITITGHDPAFIKDAQALDRALTRITELARDTQQATHIAQLHEVHALLLGDRPGAGLFRKERVMIRGASHTPPKTWEKIMEMMGQWQAWSRANLNAPAPIRCAVLHAWLTHVHPYIDGNGRLARSIGNLELIRAGYPPIIIKKNERMRYIEALAEFDEGGDIRAFMELVFERIDGALIALERSANRNQGFDPFTAKVRQLQQRQLGIWETGVKLLASLIAHHLSQRLEAAGGVASVRHYDAALDLDDYQDVCNGKSVSRSWAFSIRMDIPGMPRLEKLAYIGHRSNGMYHAMQDVGGPSLYWATRNPDNFPKWLSDSGATPLALELSSKAGHADQWKVRLPQEKYRDMSTSELAEQIAHALLDSALN